MGTAQKFSKVCKTFVRIFRMGKYKKLEINYFITNISNLKNKNSKKELRMKIGIDLGGSHIAIGVINEKGYIVEKIEKRLMSKEKSNIKKSIEEYIEKNVAELRNKYSINEIGIAVPGSVTNTEIIKSVNLGVKDYKLVEELSKKIDLPIKMQNDAKCAAIAECKLGALRNYKRSLFLTLGTGIGGAVVINGKLLDTGNLPGCEFGHMIIQRNGIECKCGKKGCFEKYASMKALKTNLRKELGVDEKTRGQELLDYIRQNPDDKNINKIIDEFIDYLSIGISNLVNIFEPEAIGIGGSFVYFSDVLLEKLKNNIIKKEYLFNKRKELIIVTAALGNEAGIIGSIL